MTARHKVIPDTNVVLRYLLNDNPEQFAKAEVFFESVRQGSIQMIFLESVLAECVYVLTKFYKVPKKEAIASLAGLLRYKGIVNKDRDAMLEALALYDTKNIDLVDCIVISRGDQLGAEIFSFDKKLCNIANIPTIRDR